MKNIFFYTNFNILSSLYLNIACSSKTREKDQIDPAIAPFVMYVVRLIDSRLFSAFFSTIPGSRTMRLVLQRIKTASVTLTETNTVCGEIGPGLLVLVGIGDEDGANEESVLDWAEKTILTTKFWPGEDGKPWKNSVESLNLSVLLVSQFTLYAKMYKKGKLDFHKALAPAQAKTIYDRLVARINARLSTVDAGADTSTSCVEKRCTEGDSESAPATAGAAATASTEIGKVTGRCQTGQFGAMMDVALVNDGPVTLMLDSDQPDG